MPSEVNRERQALIARTTADYIQAVAWTIVCSSPKDLNRAMIALGTGLLASAMAWAYARKHGINEIRGESPPVAAMPYASAPTAAPAAPAPAASALASALTPAASAPREGDGLLRSMNFEPYAQKIARIENGIKISLVLQ